MGSGIKPSVGRVLSQYGAGRIAARPIRLPTRDIKALAKKLAQRLSQWGLPKPGRVIAQEYLPLTNVRGDEVVVEILLTGTPGRNRDPFSNEMLNGGFLKRRPEGPVMRVFVNPHLDPRTFEMRPRRIIESELYRILAHELTHAADIWSGKGSVGDPSASKTDFKKHHHNHPAEVRALMRDVVTEVEPSIQEFMDMGMSFNMAVRESLKDSKWPDIEPYLTPRNKKTILKGVYTHLKDQGFSRVAQRFLEASISFRDEKSPRVQYARRFSLCDSDAEAPHKTRDKLFTDQYRRHSLKTHKPLKKPILDSRGVSDPCDVAYIDYGGGGRDYYLHLVITRADHRGKGLATKLLTEFYKKKVPKGAAVRWGRILNPVSMALFEKMKKLRPDVAHMGGRFY